MFWTNRLACLPLASLFLLICTGGCSGGTEADQELPAKFRKLLPLHTTLGKPQPGDWLDQHEEAGQTYAQYLRSDPVRPEGKRRVIYILPLGQFNPTQRKILDQTAEFMGAYFGLPVKTLDDVSLDVIPAKARRTHPTWGDKQILSTYVLDELLPPRMPKDAVVLLALTASDLWPGEGWNFVFGQASLNRRVGVWSIYRNGDPTQGDEAFRTCLRRTLQTSTHETGHMFTMHHCILYECNMCGSNHREESDRRPMALCPVCLAKLCHATGVDPAERFERLIALCKKYGLTKEEAFYRKSLETLKEP
ncbi:MAG: hypothetical protein JW818_07845 [Pirellulales bacterium]|nr:hypothetical protein [Pirellulales bacterium]